MSADIFMRRATSCQRSRYFFFSSRSVRITENFQEFIEVKIADRHAATDVGLSMIESPKSRISSFVLDTGIRAAEVQSGPVL